MSNFFKSITVERMFKDNESDLEMSLIAGKDYLKREITYSNINRPGLALCGYLDNFRSDLVQVMGRGENAFCTQLTRKELKENLLKMLRTGSLPCVIVTGGQEILPEVIEACEEVKIPLLATKMDTSVFVGELWAYLEDKVSPTTHMHGVLVQVSGLGVLITGEAGIGKSECALELIKRGHIFIVDDVVEVQRRRGNMLLGLCPSMLKHYMEVRGLGIIDIELLFGVGAIADSTKVELIVDLTHPGKDAIDRLGIDKRKTNILGVEVPMLHLPVTPGRNLAVLIEVAALNQQLKNQGIFSAEEFSKKVMMEMNPLKTDTK